MSVTVSCRTRGRHKTPKTTKCLMFWFEKVTETMNQVLKQTSASVLAGHCMCERCCLTSFSFFLSPNIRVNPSLHHGAPAGQTSAAVHQPSECRLQDLHQVREEELIISLAKAYSCWLLQ